MNLIVKLLRKGRERNYEYRSIISETLPVYHDRFKSTNKNTITLSEEDDRFTKVNLEKQGDTPVKFHKNFSDSGNKGFGKHTGELDFEMEGIRQGQIIEVDGCGFLENSNSVYEVILVTNKYVYLRNLEFNTIYPSSFKEIERMKDLNAFKVAAS